MPSDYGPAGTSCCRGPCPTGTSSWRPSLRAFPSAAPASSLTRLPQSCFDDKSGVEPTVGQEAFLESTRNKRIAKKRAQRREKSMQRQLDFQRTGIRTLRREGAQRDPLVAPIGKEGGDKEYTIVRAIVDSGAEDTVAPPGVFPSEVVPSPMSQAGRSYRAANGAPIENKGQTMALFSDVLGRPCGMPFQIASVERPLISVTQLGDSGHEVKLEKNGGAITHIASGRLTPL